MKATKLALAMGLALAGSAATAQTTVTLYGIADGNVRVDHTSVGTLKSVGSGGEASSRWGIRGTEDLGGGLKAIFNFEQDIDLSDNSAPQGNTGGTTPTSPVSSTGSRLFGRRAVVGLNSATFGEVRFGREYTPLYQAWATADPFGTGTVGRATNWAVGNVTRFDNTVTYESPAFYGVQAKLQYRPGEATTNSIASGAVKNGGQGWSGSLTYAAGPVYVGVGYLQTRNAVDQNTSKAATASATYDLKVVKLHALYYWTKNETTTKQMAYGFGVTVPIQAFKIFASAARVDNQYRTNNSPIYLNDTNFYNLGANYAFSRRTDVYVAAAKAVNNGAAALFLGDNSNNGLYNATNVPAGFNPWSAQMGVRHVF